MIGLNQTRMAFAVGGLVLVALVLAFAYQTRAAHAEPAPVPGGSLDWGVKESFLAYITGNIANGGVEADGATANADGSYRFPLAEGTTDSATGETSASFAGSLHFTGHDEGTGPMLDLLITNIRVEVAGVTGTLTADVTTLGLGETEATVFPDTAFATLDFSATPPSFANGMIGFVGVPAVLTADGALAFAGFYDEGTELDPVTLTLQLPGGPPSGTDTPPASATAEPSATTPPTQGQVTIQLSKTTVNPDGDTITVTGSGFLPDLSVGTRPPLAGQPAGFYVTFASFADSWRPSEGANSASRPTYGQDDGGIKWAVLEASRDVVGSDASVTLNPDGTFTAVISVKRGYDGAHPDGNYGIYTYPGSGASQPLFETFTPVQFTAAPQPPPTGSGLADGPNWTLLVVMIGVVALSGSAVLGVASLRK